MRKNKITIGVLGGGPLGRMLIAPAFKESLQLIFLDYYEDAPAMQDYNQNKHIIGGLDDEAAIEELSSKCDVLTIETVDVNVEALKRLQRDTGKRICPDPDDIGLTQDMFLLNERLKAAFGTDVFVERYAVDSSRSAICKLAKKIGYPLLLGIRKKGRRKLENLVIKDESCVSDVDPMLPFGPLYGSKMMDVDKELAVTVVRQSDGQVVSYSCVEIVNEEVACKIVYAPADVPLDHACAAKNLAEKVVSDFFVGAGVFTVQLLSLKDGTCLINDIDPRPHTSGLYTIETCDVSQFQALLQVITDDKLAPNSIVQYRPAITHSLLYDDNDPEYVDRMQQRAHRIPGASVHIYGSRPHHFVCEGHITITGSDMAGRDSRYRRLLQSPTHKVPIKILLCMLQDDAPGMKPCEDMLGRLGIAYDRRILSADRQMDELDEVARTANTKGYRIAIAATDSVAHQLVEMSELLVIGICVNATSTGIPGTVLMRPISIAISAQSAGLIAARALAVADETRSSQRKQETSLVDM